MQAANNLKRFSLQIVPDIIETSNKSGPEIEVTKQLLSKLTQFVDSLDDEYFNIEPWFIFNAWLDHNFSQKDQCYDLFRSWQMFHWQPDPATVAQPIFSEASPTIAAAFLKQNRSRLSEIEVLILESALAQKIDIYEVLSVQDEHLLLFGGIGQTKMTVHCKEVAANAREGHFLFANVLESDSFKNIFIGCSQLLPSDSKTYVDDFCHFVKRCDATASRNFKSFESDLFNLFYDMTRELPQTL